MIATAFFSLAGMASMAAASALPIEIAETNLTARANLVPCYGYYLDGNNYGTLWATCPNDHYVDGLTYLDLNKCLINNFGKLEWQNGGGDAMKTCYDCSLSDASGYYPKMSCKCSNGKGKNKSQKIELMDQLYNYNGVLGCFWTTGTRA